MAKRVVIDEVHVTFRVPADLPDVEAEVVRRTLTGTDFLARLGAATDAVVRASPELAAVGVVVSR